MWSKILVDCSAFYLWSCIFEVLFKSDDCKWIEYWELNSIYSRPPVSSLNIYKHTDLQITLELDYSRFMDVKITLNYDVLKIWKCLQSVHLAYITLYFLHLCVRYYWNLHTDSTMTCNVLNGGARCFCSFRKTTLAFLTVLVSS